MKRHDSCPTSERPWKILRPKDCISRRTLYDAELTAGAMETAGKHGKTAVAVTLLPKLEHELAMITLQVTTFLNTCAEC